MRCCCRFRLPVPVPVPVPEPGFLACRAGKRALGFVNVRSVCCFAIGLAACDSGSKLTLGVSGTPIADGLTPVTVEAHASTRGAAVVDGTEVNFTTTLGSFSATEAAATLQV